MKNKLIYCSLGFGLFNTAVNAEEQALKPNILFISIDDLRPELNCYGAGYMYTPNMDRLASQGTLFQRAYSQLPMSNPSRNSLLTGLRPDAIGIYDLNTNFRKHVPEVTTLPQYFKKNGYRVETVGKVFHITGKNHDDTISWSVPKWNPDEVLGRLKPERRGDTTNIHSDRPRIGKKLLPYYASLAPEENMTDTRSVQVAIERIKTIKNEPFFFAIGFARPHLPFVAPKKYFDLYDIEQIEVPSRQIPKDMPELSLKDFSYLRSFHGMPQEGEINDEQTKKLIQSYRACVSFVDAQIGLLLDVLEENNLMDNTIIVLWGDHGYKLGDYNNWDKLSNHDIDNNIPFIFTAPSMKAGQVSNSLVELVDVYPTLCDLAGLPLPEHLEGNSLLPLMKNPQSKVKDYAITQCQRGKNNEIMGYSIRSDKYRYTRWIDLNDPDKKIIAKELYDQSNGKIISENLADSPKYKRTAEELDSQLSLELSKYKTYKP